MNDKAKAITHLGDLTPDPANVRLHNPRNVGMIEQALNEVGAARSIVIDETGRVLAGNATIEAAAQAGIEKVQVIDSDGETLVAVRRVGLTEEQKRRLALYDNRAAELATWDADALAALVKDDAEVVKGLFSDEELSEVLSTAHEEQAGGDTEPQIDRAEELREKWGVEVGQVWALGDDHRVACGDCTDRAVVERVMGGEKADMVFTDPPYGIKVVQKSGVLKGQGSANQLAKSRAYSPVISDDEDFDPSWLLSIPAERKVIFGANYFCDKLPIKSGWIVWDKKGDAKSNDFADCELAWTSEDSPARIYRVIWRGMIKEGESGGRYHPTQKPIQLVSGILKDMSKGGDIVFDPFLGSGTTLIACQNLGRKCRGIEIAPGYVAVTLQRFLDHTGIEPVLIQ